MIDSEKLDLRYQLLKSSANDSHTVAPESENNLKVDKMDYLIKETGNRLVRIEAKQNSMLRDFATKEDIEKAKNFFVFWILFAIFSMPVISFILKKI